MKDPELTESSEPELIRDETVPPGYENILLKNLPSDTVLRICDESGEEKVHIRFQKQKAPNGEAVITVTLPARDLKFKNGKSFTFIGDQLVKRESMLPSPIVFPLLKFWK